jgi:hypothetical protein
MGMGPGRHPNGDGGSPNQHTGRYERAG